MRPGRAVALRIGVVAGLLPLVLVGCGGDAPVVGTTSSTPAPTTSVASAPTPTSAAPTVDGPPLIGPVPATPQEAVTSLVTQLGSELAGVPGGTDLGAPTFDQCQGTYPSEDARTARALVLRGGSTVSLPALSVETVSYSSPVAAEAAVGEVRSTTSGCGYTDLDPADQDGLSPDRVARTYSKGGRTMHILVVRRGQVVAVVIGSDTVVADSTARTMTLYLDTFPVAATGG